MITDADVDRMLERTAAAALLYNAAAHHDSDAALFAEVDRCLGAARRLSAAERCELRPLVAACIIDPSAHRGDFCRRLFALAAGDPAPLVVEAPVTAGWADAWDLPALRSQAEEYRIRLAELDRMLSGGA